MLYLLKKKLNGRTFLFVSVLLFVLLYVGLTFFWASMENLQPESFYYFLSLTSLVSAATLLILDVLLTFLVLLLKGYTFEDLLKETSLSFFVLGLGIYILFFQPYNTSLYFKLLQDIPNVISKDFYIITTSDFDVKTEQKKYHSRNNTHTEYLDYAIFDGYKARLTPGQYHEYITFLSDMEYLELLEIPFEVEEEYTITYLPHSKCIIKIEYPKIPEPEQMQQTSPYR